MKGNFFQLEFFLFKIFCLWLVIFFTWNRVIDVVGTPIAPSIRCVHQQGGQGTIIRGFLKYSS